MTKELLIKFLTDQCTDNELKEVIHWVKKNSLDNRSKSWGYNEWKNYIPDNMPGDEKFDSLLDKIHHKININRGRKPAGEKLIIQFTTWLTRAAAVLLIPVMGLLLYTLYQKPADVSPSVAELHVDSMEIVAPIGSQTRILLSDGSEVYLNHGSKLKYPNKFAGKTREVVLSGEGYFNVAHNPEKPFHVRTGNLNIKALGTSFNVFAYPEEKWVSATLVTGKTAIEKTGSNHSSEIIGTMKPGQHVSYNIETGEVSLSERNIEQYISWKDGKLIFKNESIVHIARRLSRWYNVDIEFADAGAKKYSYTATFMDETLWQILDLLKMATPIKYEKKPREKLPDGTFAKQKIIIKEREIK